MSIKCTAISDTHEQHRKIKFKEGGDLLVHTGDFSLYGEQKPTIDFLQWLQEQKQLFKEVIFICGNHDYIGEEYWFKDLVKQYAPDCIYLDETSVVLTINDQTFSIYGSPATPELPRWAFYRTKEQLENLRSNIPKVDILLTHCPPYNCLDYAPEQQKHFGDKSFSKMSFTPKYHFVGHIHESHAILTTTDTTFINSCILDDSYQIAYEPITLELEF